MPSLYEGYGVVHKIEANIINWKRKVKLEVDINFMNPTNHYGHQDLPEANNELFDSYLRFSYFKKEINMPRI